MVCILYMTYVSVGAGVLHVVCTPVWCVVCMRVGAVTWVHMDVCGVCVYDVWDISVCVVCRSTCATCVQALRASTCAGRPALNSLMLAQGMVVQLAPCAGNLALRAKSQGRKKESAGRAPHPGAPRGRV